MKFRTAGAAVLISVILMLTSCTNSPKEQAEREFKASGVGTFTIQCDKDLWEKTSVSSRGRTVEPRKVDKIPGNIVRVSLSGTEMVDYLRNLDAFAHGGADPMQADDIEPLAKRMYDEIAPTIDKISTSDKGNEKPAIVIDDRVVDNK